MVGLVSMSVVGSWLGARAGCRDVSEVAARAGGDRVAERPAPKVGWRPGSRPAVGLWLAPKLRERQPLVWPLQRGTLTDQKDLGAVFEHGQGSAAPELIPGQPMRGLWGVNRK